MTATYERVGDRIPVVECTNGLPSTSLTGGVVGNLGFRGGEFEPYDPPTINVCQFPHIKIEKKKLRGIPRKRNRVFIDTRPSVHPAYVRHTVLS